jgi:hypothetical protein
VESISENTGCVTSILMALQVKGKGPMRTYWVGECGQDAAAGAASDEDMDFPPNGPVARCPPGSGGGAGLTGSGSGGSRRSRNVNSSSRASGGSGRTSRRGSVESCADITAGALVPIPRTSPPATTSAAAAAAAAAAAVRANFVPTWSLSRSNLDSQRFDPVPVASTIRFSLIQPLNISASAQPTFPLLPAHKSELSV